MNGFINLNKPLGITSHDAVARIRRLVGRKVKVGHAGTLDPAASGVLPIAIGQATRLIEYLTDSSKSYRASVRLGVTTETDDAEGAVLETRPVPALDRQSIEHVLEQFRGDILQVPPMYSALHHEGKRLYELARAGETVERPARPIRIERLELVDNLAQNTLNGDLLVLDVDCSKGTYIRSLARDIGEALGCGAHLAALERTAVGSLSSANAIDLAQLEADPSQLIHYLLPMEFAVADWHAVYLDQQQATFIRTGRTIKLAEQPAERLRAYDEQGNFFAVISKQPQGHWKADKVFGIAS
jgi:tRNA pseudouridine55 synthase